MNTKIYYYLIGVLVISIAGLLVFQNIPYQSQEKTIPVVTDTGSIMQTGIISSGSLITGSQNNPLVYTNTEYGFQLTLPEGWEGYRVFIYTGSTIDSGVSISFALPTTSSGWLGVIDPNNDNNFIPGYTGQYTFVKGYADMLGLSILTCEQYNTFINTPHVMYTKENLKNLVRGRTEKFVYMVVGGPNDRPPDIYKERIGQGKDYFEIIRKKFKTL